MRQPTTLDPGADEILARVHHAPDDAKPISPERRLWLSVVALCWADAFGITPDYQIRYSDGRFRRNEETLSDDDSAITVEAYRSQCRNWLIQNIGEWKSDREFCCDLAGLDPDTVMKASKAKLAQVKAAEAENREVKAIELDRAFARLLDDADSMDAQALDMALAELAALERAA